MPAAAIASGVTKGIGSLFKMGKAIKQMRQGKKLQKELERNMPISSIPNSTLEGEALARSAYNDNRLPGQTAIEENLKGETGNLNRSISDRAGSGAEALFAMLAGQNQQNNALTDIGIKGAQMQNADRAALMGQLNSKAVFEDQNWLRNEYQPYMNKAAEAAALRGAGATNIANTLEGGADFASSFLDNSRRSQLGHGDSSVAARERRKNRIKFDEVGYDGPQYT